MTIADNLLLITAMNKRAYDSNKMELAGGMAMMPDFNPYLAFLAACLASTIVIYLFVK